MPLPLSNVENDVTECISMQQQEWEVLESIYPECVTSASSESTMKLEIPVELGEPRTVSIVDHDQAKETLSLSILPPLLLQIILPPSYPLYNPPELVSIRATHHWMPHIPELQSLLLQMWQAGEGVLYNWVEFIRSGEFIDAVNLISQNAIEVIEIPHPAPHLLSPLLRACQTLTQSTRFSQSSYLCSICLEYFKGSRCLQLSCGHIFCRCCLEDFWRLCITEGDVSRVGCPDPECVKAKREADEEEVARVVSEVDVRRWRWLKEKSAMERDPSILHCPMAFCQKPVPKPPVPEDREETSWDRLRTCSSCSYSFCALCKRTWHGPVSHCPISSSETLVKEYLAAPEGSPARITLERRFGKANVLRLVRFFEEEQWNNQWFESSTMTCPGCETKVEKSMGCNHMTCARCSQHFCYRCGNRLDGANPYKHFSTPGHGCYNKLFDQEHDEWELFDLPGDI